MKNQGSGFWSRFILYSAPVPDFSRNSWKLQISENSSEKRVKDFHISSLIFKILIHVIKNNPAVIFTYIFVQHF